MDSPEKLLTVSPYNNRNLVSIRIYANGQPTRQGITMGAVNFNYLRNFLHTSAEFVLGCAAGDGETAERLRGLSVGMRRSARSRLLGCTGVDPYSFQLALATKALERKVVLVHPLTVYKLLYFHYRDEIEKEIVAELLCAVPDDNDDTTDDDVKPMV